MSSSGGGSSGGGKAKVGGRRIRFSPVAVTETGEVVKTQFNASWAYTKKVYIRIVKDLNRWEWTAIALLSTSTLLFFIAFLTNSWGTLVVRHDDEAPNLLSTNYSQPINVGAMKQKDYNPQVGEYWQFGLWQCCRNDGFCLGPRFAQFYAATRAFAVLGLFGHIITLLWFVGHTVEKIVRCDICAYSCLIGFSWCTALFVMIAVCCFGVRWPVDFGHEFQGTNPHLGYSFYLAVVCCPLMVLAGVFILVHMLKLYIYLQSRQNTRYLTAEELLGKDEEGNIKYV